MPHALVLGGTRGLGRDIVKLFSSAGYRTSVIGRREPPETDKSLADVRYWIADLVPGGNIRGLVDEIVTTSGPLNYLVFCQRYRGSEDAWRGELDTSLTLTKEVVETSQNRFDAGGDKSIVIVSSVFGEFVGEGQALSYHVGKAGMNHMMRYYAVNLGRSDIRVNGVTPFTFLKEESREFYFNNEPLHKLYRDIIPLGRMSTSEDSAKLIGFLCSPQSSFITGQNIFVDGGLSLVWPETLARKLVAI